jgi:hypothetical protein
MRLSRPTPALVIAVIALFVAMGGTGYAALKVTGKNVKNGSLSGKDVKKNSLTGKQIAESKLAKVPKAKLADSAASAANADKLDGHDVKCPAFTRVFLGKCWDLQIQAPRNVYAAASECGKRGGSLPAVLELREFGLQADVNLGEKDDGSDHLSSDVSDDDAQLEVMTAEEGGGIAAITTNLSRPYRCVFPLVS